MGGDYVRTGGVFGEFERVCLGGVGFGEPVEGRVGAGEADRVAGDRGELAQVFVVAGALAGGGTFGLGFALGGG